MLFRSGKLTLRSPFLHRRNRIRKALLHIAHKRCNVCFKGAWRAHTPPHQQDRTQWPTRANKGNYVEESRWAYLPILLADVRGKQGAFRTSTHALCVDVLRRRGPAGTRSPAAGSCAAPASFTVCHRCVEVQRRTIYHFHAPCCADSIACTRCRSAALSNAVSCRS